MRRRAKAGHGTPERTHLVQGRAVKEGDRALPRGRRPLMSVFSRCPRAKEGAKACRSWCPCGLEQGRRAERPGDAAAIAAPRRCSACSDDRRGPAGCPLARSPTPPPRIGCLLPRPGIPSPALPRSRGEAMRTRGGESRRARDGHQEASTSKHKAGDRTLRHGGATSSGRHLASSPCTSRQRQVAIRGSCGASRRTGDKFPLGGWRRWARLRPPFTGVRCAAVSSRSELEVLPT